MVPIKNALEKLATELGKTEMNYERLCKDNDVIQVGIFENTSFIRKIKVKLFIYWQLTLVMKFHEKSLETTGKVNYR